MLNILCTYIGVSKAILDAGGKSVVDECNAKGHQPADGVVVTGAGNLSCKHIIHAVGQTHPAKIMSCILTVLQASEKLNLTSLSFPAFGTGAGSLSAAAVVDVMLKAIEQHTARSLMHIRIVVFQSKMVPDFQAALQKGNRSKVCGKNQIAGWSIVITATSSEFEDF
uniref:protein mono-ADP-ribosyltransferase PARP15-like n=1 Tax=Myxine glutinosa TaxID=7769 RepID=UPI00358FF2D6